MDVQGEACAALAELESSRDLSAPVLPFKLDTKTITAAMQMTADRINQWRQKADECEHAAMAANDPDAQASYRKIAALWRAMANRTEATGTVLDGLRKSWDGRPDQA